MPGTVLLDFHALDTTPLRPARPLPGLDHPALDDVLRRAMPRVQHSHRAVRGADEHSFVDPSDASILRVLVRWDSSLLRARTLMAQIGPGDLWEKLATALDAWEREGRVHEARCQR